MGAIDKIWSYGVSYSSEDLGFEKAVFPKRYDIHIALSKLILVGRLCV